MAAMVESTRYTTFVNGELLKEDTEINSNQKKNHIELVVSTVKNLCFSCKEDAVTYSFVNRQRIYCNLANDPDDYYSPLQCRLL